MPTFWPISKPLNRYLADTNIGNKYLADNRYRYRYIGLNLTTGSATNLELIKDSTVVTQAWHQGGKVKPLAGIFRQACRYFWANISSWSRWVWWMLWTARWYLDGSMYLVYVAILYSPLTIHFFSRFSSLVSSFSLRNWKWSLGLFRNVWIDPKNLCGSSSSVELVWVIFQCRTCVVHLPVQNLFGSYSSVELVMSIFQCITCVGHLPVYNLFGSSSSRKAWQLNIARFIEIFIIYYVS